MNYLQKKKLAFMSIVNQVKGFIRTIIGALPLTLEGCVDEKSVIDYKIYGQSVQDGEPTPDNPIEVESVGEKTKNLINWDYLLDDTGITKVDNGYYSEVYYHLFDTSSNIVKQLKSVLKPDTTYTLSRICDKTKDGVAVGNIAIRVNNASFVSTGHWEGLKSTTFTITQEQIDNITDVAVYFNTVGEDATISEIQLTESDTVLPYEPYGKYKIPVTVSGRNLFNEDDDDFENKLIVNQNNYRQYPLQLKPNTTYSISITENNRSEYIMIANGGIYSGSTGNGVWLSHLTLDYYTLNPNESRKLTTSDNGLIYVAISGATTENFRSKLKGCIGNLQIEEGSTATPYEPYHEPITTNIYLDEPLRKVGDYADYIDFGNGKVVREVGARILYANNIGAKSSASTEGRNYYFVQFDDAKVGHNIPLLSNIGGGDFRAFNEKKEGVYSNVNKTYFIVFANLTTQAEAREYVTNNPVSVYYIVETPTEQPITLPTIPTHKGTSIVSTDTTIQPSNAEIEYYSNAKE